MLTCPGCKKEYWPKQKWQHNGCVVNAPVVNETTPSVVNTLKGVDRKSVWQQANKERHREYMKNYMRERRKRLATNRKES